MYAMINTNKSPIITEIIEDIKLQRKISENPITKVERERKSKPSRKTFRKRNINGILDLNVIA